MVYITKSFQGILNFGAKRETFEFAKELRKRETDAEKLLWKHLRNRKCAGLKFRRQHPVKEFIIDFYCHELLLGIEIDGSVHDTDEAKEYDINRQAEIENLGILIIRFSNQQVLNSILKVLEEIQFKAKEIHAQTNTVE